MNYTFRYHRHTVDVAIVAVVCIAFVFFIYSSVLGVSKQAGNFLAILCIWFATVISAKLTTSGIVSKDVLKALGAQGYEVVVNLLPDSSQHAVPGEREIVESQGLEYIHIPVGFKQPTRADFERFSEALDRVLEKNIHMHCAANWRVSAFYSLYEVRRAQWTISQATEFMHSVWKPADHPGWPEFIGGILASAEQSVATDHREDG